jgi:hypothetical protein
MCNVASDHARGEELPRGLGSERGAAGRRRARGLDFVFPPASLRPHRATMTRAPPQASFASTRRPCHRPGARRSSRASRSATWSVRARAPALFGPSSFYGRPFTLAPILSPLTRLTRLEVGIKLYVERAVVTLEAAACKWHKRRVRFSPPKIECTEKRPRKAGGLGRLRGAPHRHGDLNTRDRAPAHRPPWLVARTPARGPMPGSVPPHGPRGPGRAPERPRPSAPGECFPGLSWPPRARGGPGRGCRGRASGGEIDRSTAKQEGGKWEGPLSGAVGRTWEHSRPRLTRLVTARSIPCEASARGADEARLPESWLPRARGRAWRPGFPLLG